MKYNKGEFILIPNKSAIRGLSPNLQTVFLWLCDHSDDNMQSFPSRKFLAEECGIKVKTLDRSMQKLVELGHVVKNVRTNKEEHLTNLYTVVIFDPSVKNDPTLSEIGGGRDKYDPRVGTNTTLGVASKTTQRTQPNITQPIELNTTSVVGSVEPATYGKPELNELFDYWQQATGLAVTAQRQANRNACSNLFNKYKVEGVKRLIEGVAQAQGAQYAPRIANFIQLQAKLDELLVWGKAQSSQQTNKPKGTIRI